MKARIKATGEIVKLAEYAKITLDMCDSYGNPIELEPEDVEIISDDNGDTSATDWNQVRVQTSIGAMQVILGKNNYDTYKEIASHAVGYADALVKELKK
jgi:hypothetical protein